MMKEGYSRAVEYFSITSIITVSQGLAGLINAGGKMRLLASPYLSSEDIEAINKGLNLILFCKRNIIDRL